MEKNLINEENETVTNCDSFKFKAKDGNFKKIDILDTKGILRLIESVPNINAEPFKLWLADLGKVTTKELTKTYNQLSSSY